jgi:hypothetical protein
MVWSAKFLKEVAHVESNNTEPLAFLWWRRPDEADAPANNLAWRKLVGDG